MKTIDYVSLLDFVTDGSGEDYRIDSTTVSIAAGEMSKSFTLNIINDETAECDETFNLTLSVSVSTCGAINGANDTAEVVIQHDDGRRSFIIDCIALGNYACVDQQEQCCHLISHNILLKRTSLHYQLV